MDLIRSKAVRALLQRTSTLLHPFKDGVTCVLPISVGWDYHEEDYFKSSIKLVSHRFSFCRVVVCDTLQRHYLQFTDKYESKTFLDIALNNGNEWLKRNERVFDSLNIPHSIERWDLYRLSDDYATIRKKLDLFFNNNQYFSNIFQAHAQNIYEKFIKSNRLAKENVYRKDFIDSSIEYLLEECAVVLGWTKNREDILLYPKSIGAALEETMNVFLGKDRSFLQPLQIRFKK